jgi:hypothetical protein
VRPAIGISAPLGKHGRGVERVGDELKENAVCLAQDQQIASLGDVLRRRAPVHPAAMLLTGDTRQFPYQRHERVPGARKTLVEPSAVQKLVMRGLGNRAGASFGMIPSSACALASAASTSSQACQRFSSR